MVASWVTEVTGESPRHIQRVDDNVSGSVRFSFKYAAIRNVYGTPTFFINQIMVNDLGPESGVEAWAKHIDPLLARGSATAREKGEL